MHLLIIVKNLGPQLHVQCMKIFFNVLLAIIGHILYSGKFSHGAKFCGFADGAATAKIKTHENFNGWRKR